MRFFLVSLLVLLSSAAFGAGDEEKPQKVVYPFYPPAPQFQTWEQADAKSAGCITCHTDSDQKTMHASEGVILGCVDSSLCGESNLAWFVK